MNHLIEALGKRRLAVLFACCSLACGEPDTGASVSPSVSGACAPDSKCSGCADCFEFCRCGGGSSARCADRCSLAGTADAGAEEAGATSTRAPLTATVVVDGFDIPAGEEFFRCQNFRNPFGQDVAVLKTESFMTSGSHHMFLFQSSGATDGDLHECGGLEFGPALHTTQGSQHLFEYPEGIGRFLSAGDGLRAQIHFLNPTSETVHVDLAVTLHATQLENVEVLAGNVFANTFSISVAPHSSGTTQHACMVPKDIKLLTAASHMHRYGVYYTARDSEGQLLYETNEWAEPEPWHFDPPRVIKAGSSIDIECQYENPTNATLSFGESALTNEMCIFTGIFYPAEPGEAITCLF